MKVLIIDDEDKARRLLTTIIKEYCPEITETKEADSLMNGISIIRTYKPDVVFLDVEMPDYLGIEIGDFLEKEEMNFSIVFTTAYSHYAIKAFEVNAVDYLLKPIRPKQVKSALQKIIDQKYTGNLHTQLSELKENVATNDFKKIAIPISDGILFVKMEEIICMIADGMYTTVYTTSFKPQVIAKPLKYFVELLESNLAFYRTHRSCLININFVKQYVKKNGHGVLMENGVEAVLARDKKEDFLKLLS